MASNEYAVMTVDGEIKTYRRAVKQGRPKAAEVDRAICVSLAPSALKVIDTNAENAGMSRSAWLELAGVLFTI